MGNVLILKMAADAARSFCNFFNVATMTKRTLVVFRTGIKSSIPCMAILNRPFSDSTSPISADVSSESSPTISRSPLFSGKKVAPKRFQLSFEEFQKLRRKLRTRQRLAGLPIGMTALLTSSVVSAYMFPNMFDATPEQIEMIL